MSAITRQLVIQTRRTLRWGAFVMIACALACHEGQLSRGIAEPCSDSKDCRVPFVCDYGRCRAECERGGECDEGECVPSSFPHVRICLPEEACRAGRCAKGLICASDAVCRVEAHDSGIAPRDAGPAREGGDDGGRDAGASDRERDAAGDFDAAPPVASDGGQDGAPDDAAPSDAAPTLPCGPNDVAECDCTLPHAGPNCSACAPGFIAGADGCVLDCGPCGEHQLCSGDALASACVCAPGYRDLAPGDSLSCAPDALSTFGLRDPRFADPTAWSTRLADFDPDYFAPGDGIIHFNTIGECYRSSIAQTFDMPPIDDDAPQVFAIEYFGAETASCYGETALSIRGQPLPLPTAGQNGVARVCLGEAASGLGVELELHAMSSIQCPGTVSCSARSFGGISIVPARDGECGRRGGFGNADFSHDFREWQIASEVQPRLSSEGALVLEHRMCGALPWAQNSMSVPLASTLPNPALRFTARVDLGPQPELITNRPAIVVGGNVWTDPALREVALEPGTTETVTICLPSYMQGTSRTLSFTGFQPGSPCAVGSNTLLYTMSFGQLALVSHPDCAAPVPEIAIDGIPIEKSTWDLKSLNNGAPATQRGAVSIVNDPSLAHSGAQAIQLQADTVCTINTASTRAVVPWPRGAEKPMLRFWHRGDGHGQVFDARTVPFDGLDRPFYPGATWQREELCIEDTFYGQLMTMYWELLPRGPTCSQSLPDLVTIWIDDIELGFSTNCP